MYYILIIFKNMTSNPEGQYSISILLKGLLYIKVGVAIYSQAVHGGQTAR